MAIRGVLFDFSGTLFRLFQDAGDWRSAAELDGELSGDEQVELMRRLTAPVGRPAGLAEELHTAWEQRDLDAGQHRRVYEGLLRESGLGEQATERLYALLLAADSWSPYPDTVAALRRLDAARIPVGVLSNIAWDIAPVFARHGVDGLVRAFVLSYQVGRVKPDPELFRAACAAIGTEPADTLMIGDSAEADGGAAEIGCPVVIVDPLPVTERPNALIDALDKYEIG